MSDCRGSLISVVPVTDVNIRPWGDPPRMVEANPMAFCSCRGKFRVDADSEWRSARVGCFSGLTDEVSKGRTCVVVTRKDV